MSRKQILEAASAMLEGNMKSDSSHRPWIAVESAHHVTPVDILTLDSWAQCARMFDGICRISYKDPSSTNQAEERDSCSR